ncbi:MAG: DNA-directed RNA polymerase sigma-70 factor [Vicingaceae bacterium]|nr:MAG: DNA-directed RNA polymerase sigma-70 factor [Vicingaceae bacterium]
MTEQELIERCIKQDRVAQKYLFDKYARRFKAICMRYAKFEIEADDMVQDAFIKIFEKIQTFGFNGSFEGWMRRIVVNTAIDHVKRNKKHSSDIDYEQVDFHHKYFPVTANKLDANTILKLINCIPDGYRTVFNLYAIEGYSHKEIAEMLGITESTSKSQYSRAKLYIQKLLKKNNMLENTLYEK